MDSSSDWDSSSRAEVFGVFRVPCSVALCCYGVAAVLLVAAVPLPTPLQQLLLRSSLSSSAVEGPAAPRGNLLLVDRATLCPRPNA